VPDFHLLIDGQLVTTAATTGVVNPASGEVFAEYPYGSPAEIDWAVGAAAAAFPAWRASDERAGLLRRCAGALKSEMRSLAELITLEQGKPRRKALHEVSGAVRWFQQTAERDLTTVVLSEDGESMATVRLRPHGVVGAITPWNYPIILAVWKIAPALLAGNTVVLKPSPFTPLSTLRMGAILRDVLPPGVLNVVSGGDDAGARLVSHPLVRLVSLTGSTETGVHVAAVAAGDLKRVVLELGGNDAAIVLPDVDVDDVAERLTLGALENSGQVCQAIKRLYVHEDVFEPLLRRLTKAASALTVGDGREPGIDLGPVTTQPQFQRVQTLVEDARDRGATIVTGGEALRRPGTFYPPTLVTDVAEDARIVAEEQFGPILPVLPFKDPEEAIARANATMYGLSGSVWTRDVDRGTALAAELDCGTAWVNQHNVLHPEAPIGGTRMSGLGYQNGRWGLEAMGTLQVVNVRGVGA